MERRKFVKLASVGGILLPTIIKGNVFNVMQMDGQTAEGLEKSLTINDKVLVIVQLSGGNDGLNTLIPLSNYSDYFTARQNIAIPENQVLSLPNYAQAGLHPALQKLHEMYTEGKLEIIQAVGYPNPNFSHFRATDIWMSASNNDQYLNTGWAGRMLNYMYPNYPTGYPNSTVTDPLAMEIGSSSTLTCQGPVQSMGITINDPASFYNLVNGNTGTIPNTNAGTELSFLRQVSLQTNQYATRISAANAAVTTQSTYPTNNSLADKLKIVARLIKGGLQTKVYMVSFGGFDTHANQVQSGSNALGDHANLLTKVAEAISSFQKDLNFLGIEDRVMGMTYSEFGRRIVSNASLGTDHGAAAPMFLFGTNVVNQVVGVNPTLTNATVSSNIPFQYDFRDIYASIMNKWFCIDFPTVESLYVPTANTTIQSLPFVKDSVCAGVGIQEKIATESILHVYPNPFTDQTKIEFYAQDENVLIQVLDGGGSLIDVLVSKDFIPGRYSLQYNTELLPAGLYYFRIQNGANVQVFSAIKVR